MSTENEEQKFLRLIGIISEKPQNIGDAIKHPSYAGSIYSRKTGTTIPVLHKFGESKPQALKRVSARHN